MIEILLNPLGIKKPQPGMVGVGYLVGLHQQEQPTPIKQLGFVIVLSIHYSFVGQTGDDSGHEIYPSDVGVSNLSTPKNAGLQ